MNPPPRTTLITRMSRGQTLRMTLTLACVLWTPVAASTTLPDQRDQTTVEQVATESLNRLDTRI